MFSNSEINNQREIGKEEKMYTHDKSNDTQFEHKNNMDE